MNVSLFCFPDGEDDQRRGCETKPVTEKQVGAAFLNANPSNDKGVGLAKSKAYAALCYPTSLSKTRLGSRRFVSRQALYTRS